jgi:hypothetical protein
VLARKTTDILGAAFTIKEMASASGLTVAAVRQRLKLGGWKRVFAKPYKRTRTPDT